MQRTIEVHGQGRYQCSTPVGHRGVFIILNEFSRGWVAFVGRLDRQVAIERDHGWRERVRGEDVMQQDDDEEDMQSVHEGAAEAAVPCAFPGENLTAGCGDAGGVCMTIGLHGSAWTEERHHG